MKLDKFCIICNESDWQDIDYIRHQPQKMILCKKCGFITFDRFSENEEYESYYETDYRGNTINLDNIVSTNRKLGYHEVFVGDYLKENKNLSMCDIGAGIGYFLNWARQKYGHKVTGVELDIHMRRYAYNSSDIELTKRFDTTKKYDFVCCYRTLEHIPDPKKMLDDIKKCMNPGGKLYLSVPVWMEEMFNFGGIPFSTIDVHFHEDHINTWTKKQFQYLLAKNGWNIIKECHKTYGYTVLCENDESVGVEVIMPEQLYRDVEYQINTMRKAAIAYQKGQFKEAIRLYPKFIDAYMAEIGKNGKDFTLQQRLCDAGEQFCKNTTLFQVQRGLILFQRNLYKEAEQQLLAAVKYRPCDDNILLHLALIAMNEGDSLLKDPKQRTKALELLKYACEIFEKIMKINPKSQAQTYNYIGYILSKVPLKDEKTTEFSQPRVEASPEVALREASQGI